MIFINRTATSPKSLEIEKNKSSGRYDKEDVREQLQKDFYGKCYICGVCPIQDGGEVEHLISHKQDKEKKFDWNNLFLSCGHCNSIKNRTEYEENVIDCTTTNPSLLITQILESNGVRVEIIQKNIQSDTTSKLIEECFNGESTTKRKYAASFRLEELKKEMNIFYKILNSYKSNKKTIYKKQIESKLKSNSKFTAFKRDYLNLHKEEYSEFLNWN